MRKIVKEDVSSISAQRKKINRKGGEYRRSKNTRKDGERRTMINEQKRRNRSHHQTNTRAGLPFLTDSNGKEEESKGSSENKELIKI